MPNFFRPDQSGMTRAILIALNNSLFDKVDDLTRLMAEREASFSLTVAQFETDITDLKGQIALNSTNSSKPPSSDVVKPKPKPAVPRVPGAKASGGQKGHTGANLSQVPASRINVVVEHKPDATHCTDCGLFLPPPVDSLTAPRQVLDLPPMAFIATEHRVLKSVCSCGKIHPGTFPELVSAPVQYGAGILAAAVDLNDRHMMPLARIAEFLSDVTGLPISQATISSAVIKGSALVSDTTDRIGAECLNAPVLHADETGMRAAPRRLDGEPAGKPRIQWVHALATPLLTYLAAHAKRGSDAFLEIGLLPAYRGILVHDGWKAYQNLACLHALCNSHHLRELAFVRDEMGQPWAGKVITLLSGACHEVKEHAGLLPAETLTQRLASYRELLAEGSAANPARTIRKPGSRGRIKQSKAFCLLQRLIEREAEVWRFACHADVPFTNNEVERVMRMQKVKQKVSGCFRTFEGLENFCTMRSYLDTLRKQGIPIFESLVKVFSGHVPQPRWA